MHSFDNDDEAALSTDDVYNMSNRAAGGSSLKRGISMDTFGTSNSYDHELWVEKYRRKPLLQRIFAKNIWIQEETVRVLQDRIVVQSHVWSFLVSVPLTVAVVAVPVVGLY